MSSEKILLVKTTVAHLDDARRLSLAVVEAGLAACASTTATESCFKWEGKLSSEQEHSVAFKTSRKQGKSLVKWLEENHPYDLPQILFWEVDSTMGFRQWVEKETES